MDNNKALMRQDRGDTVSCATSIGQHGWCWTQDGAFLLPVAAGPGPQLCPLTQPKPQGAGRARCPWGGELGSSSLAL